MEFYPVVKKQKIDFSRPTFNVHKVSLPPVPRETMSSLAGNFADDECSTNDSECINNSEKDLEENVNVFLRLRPAKEVCPLYEFKDNKVIISQLDHAKTTEKHYTFTSVLDELVDQVDVYNQIVKPTLSNPFSITGATFASYGVSSSGKTFTILGDSDLSAGLVPRAITQIYSEFRDVIAPLPFVKVTRDDINMLNDECVQMEIDLVSDYFDESLKLNKSKSLKSWSHIAIQKEHDFQPKQNLTDSIDKVYVWVSFVEIYNEKITDLLCTAPKKRRQNILKIFSNNGNSYIPGLTWLFVSSIDHALSILKYGLNRVSYAATGVNDHSSRSHTIFTINLISETELGYQYSSFKFCDLAGAERTKKTGNVGDRLKEAGGINTSLLVLGRCLEIVQQNQTKANKKMPDLPIPVRDSKLTLLLQSSLLGNEKFFMIVNLYPTSDFFEENINVLKFGSIANQIVVRQAEIKHKKRQSFSYLMQHQLNNSIKSSLNGTIIEADETLDESELDVSYLWNSMTNEQLKDELRKQKRKIDAIEQVYLEKEREHAESVAKLRKEIAQQQEILRDKLLKRNEENKELLESYHRKKLESQAMSYERKLSEAYNEIEILTRQLNKLAGKQEEEEEEEDDEFEETDETCSEDEGDDLIEIEDD